VTSYLAIILGLFAAFGLYIAAQSARTEGDAKDYVDAGQSLAPWTYIFAGSGVLLASIGPYDFLRLLSGYGFQANELALSVIPAALVAALFQKRLWLAARIIGSRTVGQVFGVHYQSASLRIFFLVLLGIFAIPFAANLLGSGAELVAQLSGGNLTRATAVSLIAAFLFLTSAIGGWRATVYVVAALSTVAIGLLIFSAAFAGLVFDGLAVFGKGIATKDGILGDALPGVIQFTSGIGLEVPKGGLWTTTAVISFAIAATGAALSPSFGFLGLTMKTRNGFAFSQVWIMSGLAAGCLLLLGPVIAGEMTSAQSVAELAGRVAAHDQFAAACVVVMALAMLLIAVAFFAASGANIATIELVDRYIVTSATGREERYSARILLAVVYLSIVVLAGFFPRLTAALSTLALPLSAQLLPAYLGLCWVPWMSRSAVLVGLIFGCLAVLFTEPPGLIAFDGLFVPLPWGRWPLTIHSAAWGLVFNLTTSFLVAIFTYRDAERDRRDALHRIFRRDHRVEFGQRAARGAKWSLALLWIFLAIGPGAILGNTFFSHPVFTEADLSLGVPSLWVWQISFWIIGILLVWWLAYRSRLSTPDGVVRAYELRELSDPKGRRQPRWIALLVARLTARPDRIASQRERRP
jgi:solute:Na+ symporter, SSS family